MDTAARLFAVHRRIAPPTSSTFHDDELEFEKLTRFFG
jgi:hypothetical protein